MKPDSAKPKLPKAFRDAFLHPPSTARDPEADAVWLALARLVVGIFMVATLSWMRFRDAAGNAALALLIGVVGTLVVFAPARWFVSWFVPRGRPRAAFRLMRLLASDNERRAAAVTVRALAVAALPRGEPAVAEELPFLEEQLTRAEPRGSEGVLAYALLRALRSDHDGARALFALMLASAPSIFSRFARRIALTWLVADHLRRGRRADAEMLLLAARPPRWRAWWPRPRALRELERRVAVSSGAAVAPSAPSNDPLVNALAAHEFWLVNAPSLECHERDAALLRAGEAWDAVARRLDDEAAEISDAIPADLQAMLATATSDLAVSSMHGGVALAALAGKHRTLERAYDLVAERLFATITDHLEALRRRVEDARRGTEIEEWLEWATVQQVLSAGRRLGGERVRRGAFPAIHKDVTHYAVWLYNERRLFLLAHAIFRWLLAEARAVGDEDAIRLCWKNSNTRPD